MKVLVVLSLLAFSAAKPQFFLPYSTPLLTPTVKASEDTPVIKTYTASYPHAGFPFVQAALPYNYRYPYTFSPVVAAESSRQKRDAIPEAEADPALVYTTVAGLPTTGIYNQYSGFPAAVSTYTNPSTIPYTGIAPYTGLSPFTGVSPYTGLNPYTGLTPFTGVSPYTNFPFLPVFSPAKAEDSAVDRAKRSAEPEAEPQLVTTGFTGFSYPAVNTKTTPGVVTYNTFPTTYAGHPNVYTYPFQHGTYPFYGK